MVWEHIRNGSRLGATGGECICAEYTNPLGGDSIAGVEYNRAGLHGGSMVNVAIML